MSVPANHCLADRSSVAIFRLSHPFVEAVIIACIAGSLRILWRFFGPASDTPDTLVYIDAGNALFATGQMTSTYYMPLYPIMIHVAGYYGIIWLQIIASSLTAALVYLLADRIWNDRIAALGAGIVCAAHPVLIYYANLRLSETAFIFLLILGLALIYRRAFALASIAFVLANLCRPTLDLIFPFIVVAGAIAVGESAKSVARKLAVYAAIYVAMMSPWWLHNEKLYGQFVRLNLAGGVTAVLENNPSFERGDLDRRLASPRERFSSIDGYVAQDRAMMQSAVKYIVDNPLTWLRASVDRFGRLFTPWPGPNITVAQKIACAALLLPVFFLAVISIGINRGNMKTMIPLILPTIWIVGLHSATHANSRYRLPLDPLLIVMAAGAFSPLTRISRGDGRSEHRNMHHQPAEIPPG
jgi:4-amino-4-deoxy-L-arabinose transferase-like glycosyltransferase